MYCMYFRTFGKEMKGRVVTQDNFWGYVVFVRNPYGSHNLILVDHDGEAYRHGNQAVLGSLGERAYRRARRFLAERNPYWR